MAKLVPLKLEHKYIKLDKELDVLEVKHKVAKQKLLRYYEKGYVFRLISPSDTSGGVFCPPWKKITMELVAKLYKTKTRRNAFFKRLVRRFPRTERAPALNIIGKRKKKECFND